MARDELSEDTLISATAYGRVRLRTLTLIRWVAIAGQATALLVVHAVLGYRLPIWSALLVVAASAAVNIWATVRRPGPARLRDREAALYLGFDLVQLAALLYLTGGLHNPFAILILAPVTVSATVLSRASTIALSALALAALVFLALAHLPLPWPDGSLEVAPLFVVGLGIALAVSTVFVATYVFSVAEEARRMSDALAATQVALDREQRLSALGSLAAAAAHELGSPLSTIAVIAKEFARDLPADSPLRADAELLISQSARCRDILAGLAARPETDGGTPYTRLALPALVEAAAAPHRSDRVELALDAAPLPGSNQPPPTLARSPSFLHGLGNLIQNAVQFAHAEVQVVVRWDGSHIVVTILDDGPGFDAGLLEQLGEPYLSGRRGGRAGDAEGDGEHMGLGVFIAQNLLERTGATLRFDNRPEGGAEVTASWRRSDLEVPAG